MTLDELATELRTNYLHCAVCDRILVYEDKYDGTRPMEIMGGRRRVCMDCYEGAVRVLEQKSTRP